MRNRRRSIFAASLIAATLPLAGCEWWLSFETGGLSLTEMILLRLGTHIQNNEVVPNSPTLPTVTAVPGSGGGLVTMPSTNGANGATPPAVAPQPPTAPVSMTLAGRQWRVLEARAALEPEASPSATIVSAPPTTTDGAPPDAPAPEAHPPGDAPAAPAAQPARFVVVEVLAESGGLPAALRLRIPAAEWPVDSSGAPASFEYDNPKPAHDQQRAKSPVAAPSNSALLQALGAPAPVTLPLAWPAGESRLELVGQPFSASVERCSLSRADAPRANGSAPRATSTNAASKPLPVRGSIDAIVSRQDGPATRQLLRIRFAPEALRAATNSRPPPNPRTSAR